MVFDHSAGDKGVPTTAAFDCLDSSKVIVVANFAGRRGRSDDDKPLILTAIEIAFAARTASSLISDNPIRSVGSNISLSEKPVDNPAISLAAETSFKTIPSFFLSCIGFHFVTSTPPILIVPRTLEVERDLFGEDIIASPRVVRNIVFPAPGSPSNMTTSPARQAVLAPRIAQALLVVWATQRSETERPLSADNKAASCTLPWGDCCESATSSNVLSNVERNDSTATVSSSAARRCLDKFHRRSIVNSSQMDRSMKEGSKILLPVVSVL
mmetsp:Transcript_12857/g.18232  ORF Transcript_12857/g.18232 Transcript_12857/m.18232 type:complete len:269 (+) Transcript_12857:461-1267(+)